ncbi:tetratricopeptide repeat protein [Pelagibius sp.]|uniref:tetratricopeptide repeat protein n=1 Tax=Pelagibius sp. TaxID=1931238 RepID=UPI003B502240
MSRDHATLKALQTALQDTPEDAALRLTLVRAAVDLGEVELALASLEPLSPEQVENLDDRVFVAELLSEEGSFDAALDWVFGTETPEAALLRARLLLDLGRAEEAAEVYAGALAADPALEDRALEERLEGRVVRFPLSRVRRS